MLRRMARDLDFPVRIEVLPTVREPDGLAMSSRNVRLSPEERRQAAGLSAALRAAAEATRSTIPSLAGLAVLARARHRRPSTSPWSTPTPSRRPGPLVVVAASVGDTRLIDNVLIERAATPDRRGADPKGAVSVLPTP